MPLSTKKARAQAKAHMHEKSDAELCHLLNQAKAKNGKPLRHLNPEDFLKYEQSLPGIDIRTDRQELRLEGFGFRKGDRVRVSRMGQLSVSLAGGPSSGVVSGVLDNLLVVGGRPYSPQMWVKA